MKKIIICILIILLLLSGLSIYLNWRAENKRQAELHSKTEEFINKWGNFKDESSDEYVNSIKPYLSEALIEQYESDAKEIKPFVQAGYSPTSSVFEILDITGPEKIKSTYKYRIFGKRQYSGESPKEEEVFVVWSYSKQGKQYFLTEVYTTEEEE